MNDGPQGGARWQPGLRLGGFGSLAHGVGQSVAGGSFDEQRHEVPYRSGQLCMRHSHRGLDQSGVDLWEALPQILLHGGEGLPLLVCVHLLKDP